MDRFQSLVRRFHIEVAKQPASPAIPDLRMAHLRAVIQLEEAMELAFALVGSCAQTLVQAVLLKVLTKLTQQKWDGQPNVLAAIGEACDNLVVTYGTFETIGVDAEPYFDEIMRANLLKKGGPVDEHGKLGKPPGWQPPNLLPIFKIDSIMQEDEDEQE
jgi:predicted HAD superfamily Cof-like phosphohydrolase